MKQIELFQRKYTGREYGLNKKKATLAPLACRKDQAYGGMAISERGFMEGKKRVQNWVLSKVRWGGVPCLHLSRVKSSHMVLCRGSVFVFTKVELKCISKVCVCSSKFVMWKERIESVGDHNHWHLLLSTFQTTTQGLNEHWTNYSVVHQPASELGPVTRLFQRILWAAV